MNNFEEWVNDEIASVAWYSFRNGLLHLGREENIRELAHTIRNKVLHEVIEALPEEIDMQRAIDANSDAGAGHVIGHNHLLREIKSSLLNLLTKE